MVLAGIIYRKEEIIKTIQSCVEYVSENCFYCNNCWKCLVAKKLQKEASEKNLKNFEKNGGLFNSFQENIQYLILFPTTRTVKMAAAIEVTLEEVKMTQEKNLFKNLQEHFDVLS